MGRTTLEAQRLEAEAAEAPTESTAADARAPGTEIAVEAAAAAVRRQAPGAVLRDGRMVLAVLRVLVLVGVAMLGLGTPPQHRQLYWILVGVYGVSILLHLVGRYRGTAAGRWSWLVFLFDVGMVSALIVLRGDGVQGFLAAFFVVVLMAAIVDGLGNAVVNAVLAAVVYAVITRWGAGPEEMLSFGTMSQFVFFFIAAVFMGHLAQEAREKTRAKDAVEVALQESTEELKAAREVLRANDRLATLGMLSAGIAHEIKNPLAAIQSSIEPGEEILEDYERVVAEGGDGKAEAGELREVFDDCRVACRQLLRVAQDLSSVARGGSATMVPVDPANTIGTAARILKSRVKPPFEFVWEAETNRTIRADPGRVLQILLNLASNALDAMRSMGEGTLTVRAEDAGPFHIAFVVEDTGPGIPEDLQQRIFEPFFTTKAPGKGTGLGLHLVGEITRSLSGTIQLEPPTVGGARFRVELPVFIRRTNVERSDEPRAEAHPDRGRRGADSQGSQAHVSARAV